MPEDNIERLEQRDKHRFFLDDPDILQRFNGHQGKESQFRALFDALEDTPDRLKFAKDGMDVICEDRIPVFLSYKMMEDDKVGSIVHALEDLTGDRLAIDFAGRFGTGAEYRRKIVEAIRSSMWFILLLPSQSEDLDWCLFETGMFRILMDENPFRKLICIYHDEKPDQIREFTMVKADHDGITGLLNDICFNDDLFPGMKVLKDGKSARTAVKGVANQVVNLITSAEENRAEAEAQEVFCERFVRLRIPRDHNLRWFRELEKNDIDDLKENYERIRTADKSEIEERIQEILDLRNIESLAKAEVLETNAHEAIFGLAVEPSTFGGLIELVVEGKPRQRWLVELCRAVRDVSHKFLPIAVQNCVRAYDPIADRSELGSQTNSGKMFRPVVANAWYQDDAIVLNLLFSEDVTAMDSSLVPDNVMSIAKALRIGYRFRWEILERYTGDDVPDEEFDALENRLDSMYREAQSIGLDDPRLLMSQFNDQSARKINSMYDEWWKLRNPEQNGLLDVAMEKKDIPTIRQILNDFKPLNHEFLELITKRFAEDNVVPQDHEGSTGE